MEIRLLGPFEAVRGDEPVPGLTGRVRTLLAILALAAPDAVSVDAIGQRLWGDAPPANLRPSVQTSVARLRTLLAPHLRVDTTPGGYALRIDPAKVDVHRFMQLIESADSAADAAAQRERLTAALGLWRGEPFGGIRSDWLEQEQSPRLTEAYLSAVERRIDLDLAAGRQESALPELRELTARHPLRESLWLRLLTALHRSGRPAEALTLYEELRRRLADELGVDPEAQLRLLYAELLEATEPSGNHAAPAEPPRQLPPSPARFTGRAKALARLDSLSSVHERALTILAVHGQGGVGKTSLALHWAHRVAQRFPDGQLYLNLQGYGPGEPMHPEVALDMLLRGLGVSGAQIPDGGPARTALLRTVLADRKVLILLDNARDAEQVRPLLPGAGCLVLITSRSQLRSLAAREGAHRIALDRFSADDSTAYLTATFRPHGVRATGDELAELAQLCGHLPLALAIAAERVTREPLTGVRSLIAELLDHPDRLKVLDVDEDDDGALRVVFDWSYQVLEPERAQMFRLLALHPAQDLSLEAAAALAGATTRQAAQRLDGLVGAHLLEQQPGKRYQLHDLLRVYSVSLAEQFERPAQREEARGRLLDWYAHSALSAKKALDRTRPLLDFGAPPAGQTPLAFDDTGTAVSWFNRERQVLVAAVHDAARHGHHRAAYRLAGALWPYLVYVRALDDIFDTQRVALEAAQLSGDTAGEAATAHNAGRAYFQRGDLAQAFKHLEHAMRLFELIGDDRGRGWVLTDLGRLYRRSGDPQAAISRHQQAIVALEGADDPVVEARNHRGLADNYLAVGRARDAVNEADRAVTLNRRAGERRAESFALDTLATAWLAVGDQAAAVRYYQQSLEISRDLLDRWAEASTLTNLGHALHAAGNHPEARAQWQTALDLFTETGMPDTADLSRTTLRNLLDH
ncbi:AfsR/SARP family transcriptional regulator [Kribbella flavida]|uniref:AfsR/SARP family transcriptional regulator n=1 Tax=Kribbella flavida TaxID=182640 RepID=UPI00019BED76|nr:BTAD domain-containing putative transcriptional regulator [Kribbella flavida]